MSKVFIYVSDHHAYTTPELGIDNDVLRDQSRLRTEGKYGSTTPRSTTIHHHKKDQTCVGYHHESFRPEGEVHDSLSGLQEQIIEEMRTSVHTE